MKTLECLRCHRMVRLDEYKSHLATCGVAQPTPTPPTPEVPPTKQET
ncbi:MAG: hypothetical protein ACLP5V_09805 [Candidatus Bathyarchaeia archaeon]